MRRTAARVFLAYLLITIVMTWPLVAGIARDVPGDLGDPLLVMWVLGWGAESVPRLVTGAMSFTDYWNANIFHPEPLALAFSEHLFGQVLQMLPLYPVAGNLILAYNLLFISTFVLSALGVYLLVRDVLRDSPAVPAAGVEIAAFTAGLIFAFVPLRAGQIAHLHLLSSQWMPLALVGFRRFIRHGRPRALIGGAAALLLQHWSSGYYLLFFMPFVVLFVVHQMWAADRLRQWRVWGGLSLAALVVAAATLPFLLPYLAARDVHGFVRDRSEVIAFSADVYSYLTASSAVRLWGDVLRAFPQPEGELFFGLVPLALAAAGTAWVVRDAVGSIPATAPAVTPHRTPMTLAHRAAVILLFAIAVVQSVAFITWLFAGGWVTSVGGIAIRATNGMRMLSVAAAATGLLLAVSRAARERARLIARSPIALSIVLMLLAAWLSLGPEPRSAGRPLQDLGLYDVLYGHVPGFDGLRVPARYSMIAALFLSIAGGAGAAAVARAAGRPAVALVAALFLVESAFVPLPLNAVWRDGGVEPPPRIEPAADAPPVYHVLAMMPEDTVIAEFPFGDPEWEVRYVYYSTVHWKRLLNGYSGSTPHGYAVRSALLTRVAEQPDAAWRVLRDAGATHVIVHESAMTPTEAATVMTWLTDHFAVEIARFESDVLFELPGTFLVPRP